MGLEYARQLAEKGYDLILVSNRQDELDQAAASLEKDYPVKVMTRWQDLAETSAADKLFDWCTNQAGILPDVLINNAGMFFFKELLDDDLPRVEAMLNLHINTITRCCILFGNAMKRRGSGRMLIMSSMTARIPAPGITIYSATKAYLKSFGRSLSFETKPYGVTVTTVCPAAVDTGLYKLSEKMRKAGRCLGLVQRPETLVNRALRALDRGRRTYSPGIMNVLLPPLVKLLPARLIDRLGLKWMQ